MRTLLPPLQISVALALLALSGAVTGQSLPSRHDRTTDLLPSGKIAATGVLTFTPTKFIRYSVGFDNQEEKKVIMVWEGGYIVDGVVDFDLREVEWREISTSYKPLAVAVEGGIAATLYVVGWFDRTGELVIERWTMENAELRQTSGASGRGASLTPPSLTKDEIYRGSAIGPAYDAVFHPPTRELLMIADDNASTSFSKHFYSLDVDAPHPVPFLRNDLDIALLTDARGMKLGVTTDLGVCIFVFDAPKWGGSKSCFIQPRTDHQTHVLCDADRDGLFELSFEENAQYVLDWSAKLNWNWKYRAITPMRATR